MLLALQAKFDFIAHKIAGDCASLYSAVFSTTNNKSRSSLSFIVLCGHLAGVTVVFAAREGSWVISKG